MKALKKKAQKFAASEAENIVNDAPKLHASFEVGDVSAQGDLYIVRIASLPVSARPRQNRQLTDGDTQGSRHVLTRGQAYDADRGELAKLIHATTGYTVDEQCIGPVFVSPEIPTADDLAHPEHGNQGFPAGAIGAVVYQRNWDQEQQAAARVAD